MRSLKKGEKILLSDIGVLRTEKILSPGISPEFLNLAAGSVLVRDVQNGAGVQFEDFIEKSR